MTQTLIEQLEAAIRRERIDGVIKEYVLADNLRAIIDRHKQDLAEPVAYTMESQLEVECYNSGVMWPSHCNIPESATVVLYRSPQPDIVAELVKALEEVIGADKFCAEPTVSDEHVQAKADAHEQSYSYAEEVLAKAKVMMG